MSNSGVCGLSSIRKLACFIDSRSIALFISLLLCAGCFKSRVHSQSPDGKSAINIRESCGYPDCSVDVLVISGGKSKVLAWRSDCSIQFAHVAWTPDSRIAGVYVNNAYCKNVQEGYNVTMQRVVPYTEVIGLIRESIVRDYRLRPEDLVPYGGDPLEWTNDLGGTRTAPGQIAFKERYP